MATLTINRNNYHKDAIFGTVYVDGKETGVMSMELPWDGRANETGQSPILAGLYEAKWEPHDYSGRFSKTGIYRLANVPGREGVLVHPANRARKELQGCIALGLGYYDFGEGDVLGIKSSAMACKRIFNDFLGRENCVIIIHNDGAHSTTVTEVKL